jgi:hypothetical protein
VNPTLTTKQKRRESLTPKVWANRAIDFFYKMMLMANLTLIYGMRLLPEGEVTEIHDATLKLANGHEAHVTMHVLEGSREEIEAQLRQSLDAFFEFFPEI